MLSDSSRVPVSPVTIEIGSPEALRNRHVRQLCAAASGYLRCGEDVFEIGWSGATPVVRSATSNRARLLAFTMVLNQLRRDVQRERIHWGKGGDPHVRLNGKVLFAGSATKRIGCLPLSLFWMGLFADALPGSPRYDALRGEGALRANVSINFQYEWPVNVLQRGHLRLVMMEDWGKHFAERFLELQRRGDSATTLLVLTTDHAMAVGLRAHRGVARTLYVISFYEPGHTAAHVEACFDDLADVERLQARDFTRTACDYWPRKSEGEAFDTVDSMLMVEVTLEVLRELRALDRMLPVAPRQLYGALPPPTADALWYLLRYGCDDAARKLAGALRALPEGERMRRLTCHRATQPFYDIMSLGLPSTVAVFGELMADLPLERRIQLLRSESRSGTTAFGCAIQLGRQSVFAPFARLLQALVPPDQHYPLLAARTPDGTSSLYLALKMGRCRVPSALADALSSFPPMRLASLLCARSADNETGLEAAVRNDDLVTIIEFQHALRNLPDAARAYLLRPAWKLAQRLASQDLRWEAAREALRVQITKLAPALLAA